MRESIILHLDMNSYYATMEQQAHPSLRGKPIGIAGKGRGERTVMVGASIEAKRMGVKGIMSTWEAKKICPEIIIFPANYDRYIFTSKRIFSLLERFSPKVEIFSIDEAFIELPKSCSWDDAVAIAKQMKKLIKTQIGEWVTCSIGISYGKTLAKLGSELQKPDGLVLIKPENFAEIAARTPIEELCGIGWRLRPRLNQIGIETIKQLGETSKNVLVTSFGPHTGTWLHNIGNGIDNNQLQAFRELPQEKSVGHSYTLPKDITNPEDAKKTMLLLAERVGRRLRKKELLARGVSVYIRFGDKTGFAQHRLTKTFTADGYQLFGWANQLLKAIPENKPIRLVSITAFKLIKQIEHSQSLFMDDKHHEQLVEALDVINNRYGEFTVHRAVLSKVKRRIQNLPDGRNHRQFLPQSSTPSARNKRVYLPDTNQSLLRRRSIDTSPFLKRL